MSPEQQERAFALAAHLMHADQVASEEEADFMAELSYTLSIPKARLEEIEATISLLSQDITS